MYEINVGCDDPVQMGVLYTRLHQNILDVFNEYGIQIMTPAYEGDPEHGKVVPRDQWWDGARATAPDYAGAAGGRRIALMGRPTLLDYCNESDRIMQ